MTQNQDRVAQWWESLTDEQRAAAQEARRSGRYGDDLHASLRDAGLLEGDSSSGRALPRQVNEYLRMRHDT